MRLTFWGRQVVTMTMAITTGALMAASFQPGREVFGYFAALGILLTFMFALTGAGEAMRRHGTGARYTNDSCRCDQCRQAAWSQYARCRAYAKERGMPDAEHGTVSGHTYWGCRCEKCKEARRQYDRDRRVARKGRTAQ